MRKLTLILLFLSLMGAFVSAQDFNDDKSKPKPADKPSPKAANKSQNEPKSQTIDYRKGLTTGPQVGEFAILVYSNLTGRNGLNQIKKTTIESGRIKRYKPDGTFTNSEYVVRSVRSENLADEKIRIDQKFPDAEFALIYKDDKVVGVYNNTSFVPREDAVAEFRSRIWHGIEVLLRYKEIGAEIQLEKEETILGVTFYVVKVTDKMGRETKFYVSKKYLRVMMLTYEEDGVKYKRKFYDHNNPQGTLVPYRSVLWGDDKIIEEQDISTITFGQTVDDSIFTPPAS